MTPERRFFWPRKIVLLGLLLALATTGCVQRRMFVRTNPPGALLYVDDYEVGTTPISVPFTYYGTRKIRLVKDGFETLTLMETIRPPWYEIFPLDFVAENCVPGQVRDRRVLDYQLRPQMIVPTDQLLARAEELRRGAHSAPNPNMQPPSGAAPFQPPVGPEVIPAPAGVGGQPIYPLPPR